MGGGPILPQLSRFIPEKLASRSQSCPPSVDAVLRGVAHPVLGRAVGAEWKGHSECCGGPYGFSLWEAVSGSEKGRVRLESVGLSMLGSEVAVAVGVAEDTVTIVLYNCRNSVESFAMEGRSCSVFIADWKVTGGSFGLTFGGQEL